MFDRILTQMRERVRTSRYVMTVHGEEEMDADDLTVFDVESVVLTGEVAERQRDRSSREWKYLIRGQTVGGSDAVVVAKLGRTGMLVIITVYAE